MQFRKDINGLRAIAVIAVVLFHFNASWMPGGFAGVDVFFVISGFLMTGIIFRGIEQENFSILKFYVARANRIIPALAVLCLVLLVFGWFYLTPLDYRVLGKHVGSSMGFLSNIIYWRESGYFDAASHEKWLLHTWSLSAEWQFYIIYPLVLVAMRKFMSLKAMKATVLVGTVLGFIFCVIATYKWPNPAYYLLPTRAWEMMIGGVAYLYPLKLAENRKKVFEWVGLALIILSYIFISKENLWPGYLALIPVFGAFLLIQAQRNDSFATGNIIFQSLGKWSYSIYLWHWPLVVAVYYFSLNEQFIYFGIVLSVILGFISNKYVESIKFKDDFNGSFSYMKSKPIYFMLFFGALGSYVFISKGYNYNEKLNVYNDKIGYPKYCHVDGSNLNNSNDYINCKVGDKDKKPVALIWGDSYAGVLDPFVSSLLENNSAISRTTSHCVPSLQLNNMLGGNPDYCNKIRQLNIREVSDKKYKVVFLAGRWEHMYDEYGVDSIKSLFDTVDFVSKNADVVYLFEQPIFYKESVSKHFLKQKIIDGLKRDPIRDDVKANNANKLLKQYYVNQHYKNVYYVSRDIIYGNKEHNDYNKEHLPYTYDQGHLSIIGSLSAANNFKNSEIYEPLYKAVN
ncbi:TPA: acyltransferase family protein [Vibrio harveyi]